MKLTNLDLAFALAGYAMTEAAQRTHPQAALFAFAEYLANHPTSVTPQESALTILGIDDVPSETWGTPLPSQEQGTARVAASIEALNNDYARGATFARVALRRLAWDCVQLARKIEEGAGAAQQAAIKGNGDKVAGLFLPVPLTDERDIEALRGYLQRKPRTTKPAAPEKVAV
jgi:hypothetical protein